MVEWNGLDSTESLQWPQSLQHLLISFPCSVFNLAHQENPSLIPIEPDPALLAAVKQEIAHADDDIQPFTDEVMAELQKYAHAFHLDGLSNTEGTAQSQLTLNQANFEQIKGDVLNNFAKYKMKDGKYIKFYKCSICKYEIGE